MNINGLGLNTFGTNLIKSTVMVKYENTQVREHCLHGCGIFIEDISIDLTFSKTVLPIN